MKWTGMIYQEMNLDYGFMILFKKITKLLLNSSNGIIVIIGKIVFSWDIVLYAILVSYLISVFTDKVLLGISKCKAFYIVTDKKKTNIVKEFLLSIDGVGVTLMEAEGGYSKNDESLLLAVVPSKSYFIVKDGLKEIDNKMFFLVCDSYEVSEKGDFS